MNDEAVYRTAPATPGLLIRSDQCQIFISSMWRLPSYQHISKINVWKNYFTTISLWSPTHSGSKTSVSLKGFRICNNISTHFWGFGSSRPVCLKKAHNLEVFYSSPFWRLNFEISKVNFILNFWYFCYENMCPSFLWKTSS